jgi:Leucine-rich repeat (LRR) protein
LFANKTFVDSFEDKLLNLSLVNCSVEDVDFLPISVLRNLLYLDLSHNQLNDFKFPTPSHFMRLLIVLKLTGNKLVVSFLLYAVFTKRLILIWNI